MYNSIVKSTVTHRAEIWKFNNLESKLLSKEMDFFQDIRELLKNRKKIEIMLLEKN